MFPFYLALAVLLADQLTKLWMVSLLQEGGRHIPVIPGFFGLEYVVNTGAAFGLLAGRNWLLGFVAVAAMAAIIKWRHAFLGTCRLQQFAGGLILGGIAGNMVDRFRIGGVIDFLRFNFGSYVWPNFNIADSAICVGVALYILLSFREEPGCPEKGPS